jgi:hypothetical protein
VGRTILVTGGAGFIGSNFVLQRIAAGDRIITLDKLTYAGNLGKLNLVGTFRLLHESLAYYRALPPEAQARFRFLHVSTDEVYGSLGPSDPAFVETNPYQPNSPFQDRLPGRDRLPRGPHHQGPAGNPRPTAAQKRIRPISAATARGATERNDISRGCFLWTDVELPLSDKVATIPGFGREFSHALDGDVV